MSNIVSQNRFSILDLPTMPLPKRTKKPKKPKKGKSTEDTVQVKHPLKLPDTDSTSTVPLQTPIDTLAKRSPANNLQESVDGSIKVLPAKTDHSESKLNVHSSNKDFRTQMLLDVKSMVAESNEDMRKEFVAALESHIKTQEDYVQLISKGFLIRNIQDWSLGRMRKVLKLDEDPRIETIVDSFIERYDFYGISRNDLLSLKNSPERTEADDLFHISLETTSAEKIDKLWKVIKMTLNEEEKTQYEGLMKFGRGGIPIELKGC
jgi:hypothetical protein